SWIPRQRPGGRCRRPVGEEVGMTTTPRDDTTDRPARRFRRAVTRPLRTFRRTADDHHAGQAAPPVIPADIRAQVLRDYHATNLAHARHAAEELVRAGCNTGTVPYGYRPRPVRIAPTGGRPRWRHRLVIEPVEAATVKMIFTWRGQDRLPVA